MGTLKNREHQFFKCLIIGIRCFLISHGSPQHLLGVKLWTILGNIVYCQSPMIGKKFRNPFPLMPTGLIHPEINHHSLITKKDILEHRKKSVGIAFFLTHHPMSAPDGIDPSKDIQPFVMLALRQDQRLFSFLHPNPSQLGMKTKPRFIRKKENSFSLTSFYRQEFFLRSSETPPPLPSWLEHNGKSVAAKKTLIDESIAELDAPSIEPRESAQDTLPPPPHPTGFASNPVLWKLKKIGVKPSKFNLQIQNPFLGIHG